MLTLGRYGGDGEAAPTQRVTVDGSEGTSVQMAPCCRPIPGDAIVGYLGRGEGLVVHTADCSVGRRLFERDREHWMSVEWAEEMTRPFETAVNLLLRNGKGVLAQVASAVSSAEADIIHIDMGEERTGNSTDMRMVLSVRDRFQLAEVMRLLKRSPPVQRVARVKP
jgi:GTP pyrophosphokinase/guanosine-3',5'-bis(diphosphate) 3'-pyrophosphohydrolase